MTVAEADATAAIAAPTVIDVEASGFGRGSYPIEVGWVLPDGRGDCMLVRRDPAWRHWDAASETLHGIDRDLLERHGRPIAEVVVRLDAALGGRTVYTDGWGNDYPWLAALYESAGRTPSFRIDSLQTLLAPDALARFETTKAAVAREMALVRHRASADARVLQATVVRLLADPHARSS